MNGTGNSGENFHKPKIFTKFTRISPMAGCNRMISDNMEKENSKLPQNPSSNDPLHGMRLVDILEYLVGRYGWKELGERIKIRCFTHDPSISSSLKFLRKTPWARQKVEELYVRSIHRP